MSGDRRRALPDPWQCSWCGTTYPVPSLARDCERAHEHPDTPTESASS